jgi:hypothetical protein
MKDWLKNAFDLNKEKPRPFTPAEQAIIDKLARKVHRHGMAIPAILFLESVKPLNFVASQVMVFFQPFVNAILDTKEYELFAGMLEERSTIERLLHKIESVEKQTPPNNNQDKEIE